MDNIVFVTKKDNIYINNNISDKKIEGFLSPLNKKIEGSLSFLKEIKGEIKTINYIQGELLLKSKIQGFIKGKEKMIGILKPSLNFQSNIKIPFSQKYDNYTGEKKVVPSFSKQILNTRNKLVNSDIEVFEIQTYETSNDFGTTFII